ncbi:GH92 family glycosyl hydrolase [Sinomicrobium kalidii]|uniref:GH92 family glycosyl hydrolase n=1 Tax=Sinomicrobium kalidii TaxID=2900738 RepID=UPI0026762F34|nr:GH92 family glycosyl hydrolase [Sinomicrobium kalidii]
MQKTKNFNYLCIIFLISGFLNGQTVKEPPGPIDHVNPLMGTDSDFSLSSGNVYPAIAMPWGMNFWTPQTGKNGDGWTYTYNARTIRGFKQTHQPSPWMNDYGQFSLMPVTGKLRFTEKDRKSWFSHKAEKATPYYYKVFLADHNVTTEITPTERAARFRFTFPEDDSYIVVDAYDKGSYVKVIPEERKIMGYSTRNSGGVPENFKNYFVIEFDKAFEVSKTFRDSVLTDALTSESDHSGAVIGFKTNRGEQVNAKIASSFISFEQAERNLGEIEALNFDQLKEKGRKVWNRELERIQVEGGTAEQYKTFYSCLYRTLLFPRKFYEYDETGNAVHYSPYNGKVEPGYMFTDTGFWDTFRALFPFLNLMYPDLNEKIQEGLLNAYKESGWLPEWASPGLRNIMIGNNSASIVAEAFLKNRDNYDYDIKTLYEALLHGANNEGPMTAVGRAGVSYYNHLGYVPSGVDLRQSVSRTLEYAYDDFAIYQLARALKRPEKEINLYRQRSLNYKKVFDPETGFMRGRLRNGDFVENFNPIQWSRDFTEGNSMHYTWSVFHDIKGLIGLMGGRQAFIRQLDTVFTTPSAIVPREGGGIIHEMREMQIADMGQYAHGNQPIQHMIYLYNYAGQPWKTQYWVRETMNRMYRPSPDGYCGDEDNGQTSAWYVFSALGFYPVTPASDQYVLGAPLFEKATLQLENGNRIILNAPGNSSQNRYILDMHYNDKNYTKNYLSHRELLKGAVIDFEMGNTPDKKRGTRQEDFPYSLSAD